ncbi:MAG: hypothetical protein HRT99_02805 [Mycoplasmatales bacterium]|nr:hypothetical protein [Mycoplasmatales bacterium]
MKKVLNNKRKFKFKDILHWLKIISVHYLYFILYLLLFMTIKYYVGNQTFFPDLTEKDIWMLYAAIFAPIFNAILHITYQIIGSPWTRMAMWINSFIYMVAIPIIIFIF